MLTRRNTLLGLFVAPAIIRTPGLLMPIKPQRIIQEDGLCPFGMSSEDAVNWVIRTMQTEIAKLVGIPKPYLFGNNVSKAELDVYCKTIDIGTVRWPLSSSCESRCKT